MNRAENAVAYKRGGSNCAQAVLLAFANKVGLSEEQLRALGAGFGTGMGSLDATCGALCAAQMILGMLTFQGRPIIKNARALHDAFKQTCGSTDCGELKGVKGRPMLCPCDDCVRNAVKLLENMLGE